MQAALDTRWTTSPVEGQISRLKMIKRTMYGRAGFDLLRARVLHAAQSRNDSTGNAGEPNRTQYRQSPAISPIGSPRGAWRTSAAHRATRRREEKSERWHQTLKHRILLKNYYLPAELEAQVAAFVDHYNHRRAHESLSNLTPADVYLGRGPAILQERQRIKQQTIQRRRLLHDSQAA